LFRFEEFNIRGILRAITLRLIDIFKLDSLGELLPFYNVYHSVLLILDGVCRKKWGEHLTPLGRSDFHIYSRKKLNTITIKTLDIYTSDTP
jgi:hypothetical protein